MLYSASMGLHHAVRSFLKTPLFTTVAVLTLAVGIGATTAVFSVVDRVLFRGLPYRDPDRLVSWGFTGPIDESEFMVGNSYVKARKQFPPFAAVTSLSPWLEAEGDLGDRNPVRVRCIPVEANFLATLGIAPAAGRDFTREDDLRNAPRVALLTWALWQLRFGGSATALNQTVILDDQPTRIIGVLPKNFELPTLGRADILIPQQMDETAQLRGATRFLRTFARLRAGISTRQAREGLQPFLQDTLRNDVPPSLRREVHLVVRSLRERQVSNVRLASWLLFGAVLALLLIACANVANLLLARAAVKERELAMRAALGAPRVRLALQALIESLVLAVCGAIAGCAFAWLLLRLLTSVAPEGILLLDRASVDARVLVFTLAVAILAAVGFGTAPALETPRPEALTGWHAAGTRRTRLRHLLITAQIAISLVLLSGAGLFVRSLWKLERQPAGLEPAHTIAASFELSHHRYDTAEKLTNFYNQLESKLTQIPSVSAIALSDSIPPGGWSHSRPFSNMGIGGRPALPSEGGMVLFRYITPDYFRVLRISIVQGRAFDDRDRTPAQNSIILSAKLAHRIFGSQSPIGQRILLNPQGPSLAIVGVVADVKNNGLSNPAEPEYYLARKRSPDMGSGTRAVALIQSSASISAVVPWIRSQAATLDPHLPVNIETMQDRLHDQNDRPRFITVLVGLFAIFGLLLAAIGLYGVMAFLVSRQTREIGVRMALGATPGDVAGLVLRNAATWTGGGLALGLASSLALTRVARGLLFEISPHDPAAITVAIVVLAFAALIACLWPSYRASKVDPAISLRHE
jgi:putative ABC transport system permease protein